MIKTFWCWRGASQQCRRWRLTFGSCVLYFVIFFSAEFFSIITSNYEDYLSSVLIKLLSLSRRMPANLFRVFFWQNIRNVVPRMAVESLLQSPLIEIVACCSNGKRKEKRLMDAETDGYNAWLKLDAHVPIKPVHRPKTKRPLIVPISMYSCASSLYQQRRRNGR